MKIMKRGVGTSPDIKPVIGAAKMAKQVIALATKPEDLSLFLGTNMVEEQNELMQAVTRLPHLCCVVWDPHSNKDYKPIKL